jgi:hypothetical protein
VEVSRESTAHRPGLRYQRPFTDIHKNKMQDEVELERATLVLTGNPMYRALVWILVVVVVVSFSKKRMRPFEWFLESLEAVLSSNDSY